MKLNKNGGSSNIQFTMRMESELYDKLKQSAIKNRRSIAKELETAAEQYLKTQN